MKKIMLLSLGIVCLFAGQASAWHGNRGYAPPYQQYNQYNQYVIPAGHGHGHGKHWRRHYDDCDDDRGRRGGYIQYNNYYVPPPVRYVAPPPVYYAPQPAYVPVYPHNSINLQFGF